MARGVGYILAAVFLAIVVAAVIDRVTNQYLAKDTSSLTVIATAAVVGGFLALMLFKRDEPDEPEIEGFTVEGSARRDGPLSPATGGRRKKGNKKDSRTGKRGRR